MKNLIYMCIFYNKKYLEIMELLLLSLKKFGKIDEKVDILILTESCFNEDIKRMCKNINLNYKVNNLDVKNIREAKSARLKIFEVKQF